MISNTYWRETSCGEVSHVSHYVWCLGCPSSGTSSAGDLLPLTRKPLFLIVDGQSISNYVTWVVRAPYVLYGVKYIDLVSLGKKGAWC